MRTRGSVLAGCPARMARASSRWSPAVPSGHSAASIPAISSRRPPRPTLRCTARSHRALDVDDLSRLGVRHQVAGDALAAHRELGRAFAARVLHVNAVSGAAALPCDAKFADLFADT